MHMYSSLISDFFFRGVQVYAYHGAQSSGDIPHKYLPSKIVSVWFIRFLI